MAEFLWYIPNQVDARAIAATPSPPTTTVWTPSPSQAQALEEHGWRGALIGTGWGRPDTFTVATALAARTTTFEPLIAIRPGYWRPANFASAAATLDHLTGGRVRINIVSGQGQPRRLRRQRGRPGPPLRPHQGVHPARPQAVDRGERHLPRRALPGHRLHRGCRGSVTARRPAAPEALLRRRLRGRRAGRRDRGRRPAVLGRAARRRPRADRAAAALSEELGREHAAAGVRPADHHLGPRHHRAGLGRRRGEGRRDGEEAGRAAAEPAPPGRRRPAAAARPGRPRRRARRQPLHRTRASSAAAAPAPPGWSAPPRTWRSRCASTRTSASPTSCSPTPPTCRRSSARATSCCRCCGNERGSATCASRNRFAHTVTVTRPRCRARAGDWLSESESGSVHAVFLDEREFFVGERREVQGRDVVVELLGGTRSDQRRGDLLPPQHPLQRELCK